MKYVTVFAIFMFIVCPITLHSQDLGFHKIATVTGHSVGDRYFNIEGLGDVNGDSIPDFAVGAHWGNYVDIYFGSAEFDTIPDLRLWGEQDIEQFGWSITSGDMNGDGINDIIIGAPEHDNGAQWNSNDGRIYIYWGGTSLDSIPDRIFTGEEPSAQLGYSLEWSQDVNGDSYPDLLVGAPIHWSEFGRLFIFSATPSGVFEIDTLSWEATGDVNKRGSLGYSIAPLGDINADRLNDFLVGAPALFSSTLARAYLVYGDSIPSLNHAVEFVGDSANPNFGRGVYGLGHFANRNSSYFGINTWTALQIYSSHTLGVIDTLGSSVEWGSLNSVSPVSDLNQDGLTDVLIGVENQSQLYTGLVAVYFGASSLDSLPAYTISGTQSHHYFGKKVSSLGDINQDGQPEYGIGESQEFEPVKPGRVHIYTYGTINAIENPQYNTLPSTVILRNYPNPFNASTTLQYHLPAQGQVTISIYDIAGHEVLSQDVGRQAAGRHSFRWRSEATQNLPSGVYFCTITVENTTRKYRQSIKITLLK